MLANIRSFKLVDTSSLVVTIDIEKKYLPGKYFLFNV